MNIKILSMILCAMTCLISSCGWGQAVWAQNAPVRYLHNSWNTEQGLPQSDVKQLIQTRDGYIWLGTNGGLVRFDGLRFTVFDSGNTPELRSNRILALREDRNGTLWIGTQNGGLTSYSQGKFKTYTTKDGLPDESIFSIEADRLGNLWLSPGGLLRLTDGRFTLYTTRDGLPSNGSGYISEGPGGSLWFISGDYLMRFYEGRFVGYRMIQDYWRLTLNISSMVVTKDSSVWLATKYGLVRFQNGRFEIVAPNPTPEATVMQSMAVAYVYKDRAGELRLVTPSGLARYQDGKVILDTPLPELSRLKVDLWTFQSVIEDREGNLWLGMGGLGLHRFRPRQIVAYTAETGLSDQSFLPITDDGAGGLWLGNTDEINSLYHFQEGKFTPYNTNALVRSLHRDHSGTLLIGTEKGLYQLQEGKQIAEHPLTSALENNKVIQAIYEDREGQLWVGTGRDEEPDGALYRLKDGVTTKYQMSEGLVANDVRFIMQDHQGALWIGTTRGMSRFKDERFTNYTTGQGLSNNYVREIYEDADKTLWVGTYGGGLNRFKNGHFISITTKNGLFDNVVSRILEDGRGNFWMSGNRGIFRVSRKELDDFAEGRADSVTCISYGVADGMRTSETNGGAQPAGWKDRDGKLWFPTIKGVVRVDPENLNPVPPPVFIEQALVGKTPFDPRQQIEMRPGQSDLEIHYTGLSYTAPEKVRFKYKLEGYDSEWVDAGTRRVAYFTNVSPGKYTFRVMAANNDGVWSTHEATAQIIVIPPFWRTWWFMSLVVVAAATALFLLYRRRIKQLKRARSAQEAFSRQLIESQESERKRIAAELHDSLGQELLIIKNRAVLGLKLLNEDVRAREQIEQIAGTASQAITEVRQIAYNLRPYHLDEIGLTQSLEELIERVSNACPVKFTTSIDYIDDICPKDSSINLYRIVQEGVNNIIKHSEASEASLLVRRSSREIEVMIQDNGKGFDATANKSVRTQSGFGLNGLRERARILGGTLAIHSTPGKGTSLILSMRSQDGNHEV